MTRGVGVSRSSLGAPTFREPAVQISRAFSSDQGKEASSRLGPPIHEVAWAPHRHDARLTARIHPPDTPISMALVDATNVVATDAPSNVPSKPMISDSATNAPNAEKLGAALDDVASFDAATRDAAAAKLDAASAKDAPGLCIALLRVASDGTAPSARRLAAGTFARNLLRKAFWTADPKEGGGASFPDASRASVRVASLDALCAAPDGPSRALLADCLRLAGTAPCGSASGVSSSTADDPRAALANDVCDRVDAIDVASSPTGLSPGFLLAAHVAVRPFQYFRDASVARESAPVALERLCARVIAPHVVPMCDDGDAGVRRVALKIVFRAVRAYMPESMRGAAIQSVLSSIEKRCLALDPLETSEEEWIAAKRALRLAKALVTRHASTLDGCAESLGRIVGASVVVASAKAASDAAVAEAFASLESVLSATRDKSTRTAAWCALTGDAATDEARSAALRRMIVTCVVPHAALTDRDEERLVEDPEEYARLNAVGDAATSDAIEEALADDGGSCGATARAAALDFAAALVAAKGPVDQADHHPTKKHKKDNEDGEGKAPPATPGESALKDVVDAIVAEAPKEKIEKVGKSAAAAGAVAVYAAPAAENALGVSRYFGLFQLTAALASAGASRGRPMKDSAMKQFCQRHAFPAAAAARSPHVAAAAAKFIADAAARSKSAPLLRECVAALIAALEREWKQNDDDDESIDEEGVAVVKEIASWAAKSVLEDSPASADAFGVSAVGAVDASCDRLLAVVEASPASSAPALRVLGAMAEAASGAMRPSAAAGRVHRIVSAFAPFATDEDEEGCDDEDMTLDAWEASVDAAAALVEAASTWEAPEGADEAEEGEMMAAAAAAAAEHAGAYWRAAALLEPPDDDDDDDGEVDAPPPPAHAAIAPLLCSASEILSRRAADGKPVRHDLAAKVWTASAQWARHLPAWRLLGDAGLVDEDSLDNLGDVVAAAVAAKAGDAAVGSIAAPGAVAAAGALDDSDDVAVRRAAARALAVCAAASVSESGSMNLNMDLDRFLAVAVDNAEGATGSRSARAALHLLAAIASVPGGLKDVDAAARWLRARRECAGVARWTVDSGVDSNGALLGVHVAALHAALSTLVASGAPQPDKRVFGAALSEAVEVAATLLDDGPEEDEDADEGDETEGDDDSEDDSDDEVGDALENESEEEFLQRYAAIARDMADGTSADAADEDDDDEGLSEEDASFGASFDSTRGDGSKDATAFARWFETWRAGDTGNVRVSSLVDASSMKKLARHAALTT